MTSPMRGSRAAITKISKLAGLRDAGYTLEQALLFENELQLTIRDSAGCGVCIALNPPGPGDCFLSAPHFRLSYKHTGGEAVEMPREHLAALASTLLTRLRKSSLRGLEKVILDNNPEKVILPAAENSRTSPEETGAASLHRSWGQPEHHSLFFHDASLLRDFESATTISDPFIFLTHGDSECLFIRNCCFNETKPVCFFNYPWLMGTNRNREKAWLYTTDMNETDVITGNRDALDSFLDGITTKAHGGTIVLKATCLPMIIGDDTDSAVNKFKDKCAAKIYYSNQLHDLPVSRILKEMNFGRDEHPKRRKRGGINLVGFAKGADTSELTACLSKIGVKVNACIIPDISEKDVREYMEAKAQVFNSGTAWLDIFKNAIPDISMKTITPAAPFGIARTWSWLESVSEAAGRKKQFEEFRIKNFDAIAGRWAASTIESRNHRLCFIVKDHEIEKLDDTGNTWGVPLLPVVREMGFGVELLVHSKTRATPNIPVSISKIMETTRGNIRVFRNYEELSALLGSEDFQAVYSDVYYDRRLTRNGKARFSIDFFEKGFLGAERTARRLNQVCRLGFYRNYGRYLGDIDDG